MRDVELNEIVFKVLISRIRRDGHCMESLTPYIVQSLLKCVKLIFQNEGTLLTLKTIKSNSSPSSYSNLLTQTSTFATDNSKTKLKATFTSSSSFTSSTTLTSSSDLTPSSASLISTNSNVSVTSSSNSLIVVGDLHGNIDDLIKIFEKFQYPPNQSYLFLGDYVDRGDNSIEVLLLLFALKVKYPSHIHLLRGNHESKCLTSAYGFKEECIAHLDQATYSQFCHVFSYLPIAAIVNDKFFCVHGGLTPHIEKVEQIREIKKPIRDIKKSLISGLLWSDPAARDVDESDTTKVRTTCDNIFLSNVINYNVINDDFNNFNNNSSLMNNNNNNVIINNNVSNGNFIVYSNENDKNNKNCSNNTNYSDGIHNTNNDILQYGINHHNNINYNVDENININVNNIINNNIDVDIDCRRKSNENIDSFSNLCIGKNVSLRNSTDPLNHIQTHSYLPRGSFLPSRRGVGFSCRRFAVEHFLSSNGLSFMIRAHEFCPRGFSWCGPRCLTVFSSSDYNGVENSAAVAVISPISSSFSCNSNISYSSSSSLSSNFNCKEEISDDKRKEEGINKDIEFEAEDIDENDDEDDGIERNWKVEIVTFSTEKDDFADEESKRKKRRRIIVPDWFFPEQSAMRPVDSSAFPIDLLNEATMEII